MSTCAVMFPHFTLHWPEREEVKCNRKAVGLERQDEDRNGLWLQVIFCLRQWVSESGFLGFISVVSLTDCGDVFFVCLFLCPCPCKVWKWTVDEHDSDCLVYHAQCSWDRFQPLWPVMNKWKVICEQINTVIQNPCTVKPNKVIIYFKASSWAVYQQLHAAAKKVTSVLMICLSFTWALFPHAAAENQKTYLGSYCIYYISFKPIQPFSGERPIKY